MMKKDTKAIKKSAGMILATARSGKKIIIIGNGGSAAIASHVATDLLKNGNVPAMTFNDAPLITCVSNDLGYVHVFEKPISVMARRGDLLIAISSSGCSENILRGASIAKKNGMRIITLSGFGENNPLRSMGEINFYVPSASYGEVETAHFAICHHIIDIVVGANNG